MELPGSLAQPAVAETGYSGWIVVESDQSPRPAESAMVSGWYVQKVLLPIVEGSRSACAFR